MLKLLGALLIASVMTGCFAHARVAPVVVEAPDPVVGDMTCSPPMTIHDLLAPPADPSC